LTGRSTVELKILRSKIFLILFVPVLFSACVRRVAHPPLSGIVLTGNASWYGPKFHGKPTSSREIYNMYDLTAAHKTLPFGTYVMVTNLRNGKSVTVKINDRGPFVKGRILDLSYAAAKVLDMVESGVVPVRIEVLGNISQKSLVPKYSVQVGAFVSKKNAQELKNELGKKYRNVTISLYRTPRQIYYRVRIKAENLDSAKHIARRLSSDGYTVILLEEREQPEDEK
jgi:rare lipoprotein A